jgi:O-antigen ligase
MGGRSLMWTGTTGIIRDHPVWGTGLASWQWFFPKYQDPQLHGHPDYAHNDILNLASDYGIVGLGLAAWVLAAFFRCAWRSAQSKPGSEQSAFAIGAMASVV